MKKKVILTLCFLLMLCFCACGNSTAQIPEIVKNTPGSEKWNNKVDYSNSDNWLSLPEQNDKSVDLVYFYPTVYSPSKDSGEVIADIDDAGMRSLSKAAFDKQATAFSESCNIYAPFYRQVDATYALTLTDEENEELLSYAVKQDATAAIDYYFKHYNKGKPFILAGHSQGSETVIFLLSQYFKDHPKYYSRMVAAYPIGYSVTESYLQENPHLKFAEGETDTGVIISWNTEGPENIGQHNAVVLEGAKSINPLNWKTDDTYAPAELNKGSRINGEILYNIADAQINLERGVVITNADSEYAMPASPIFGPASFHLNDYDLYYNNIKENCSLRIKAY